MGAFVSSAVWSKVPSSPSACQLNADEIFLSIRLSRIVDIAGSGTYFLHRSQIANDYSQKERLDETP
jgi:hypothetical protein